MCISWKVEAFLNASASSELDIRWEPCPAPCLRDDRLLRCRFSLTSLAERTLFFVLSWLLSLPSDTVKKAFVDLCLGVLPLGDLQCFSLLAPCDKSEPALSLFADLRPSRESRVDGADARLSGGAIFNQPLVSSESNVPDEVVESVQSGSTDITTSGAESILISGSNVWGITFFDYINCCTNITIPCNASWGYPLYFVFKS